VVYLVSDKIKDFLYTCKPLIGEFDFGEMILFRAQTELRTLSYQTDPVSGARLQRVPT